MVGKLHLWSAQAVEEKLILKSGERAIHLLPWGSEFGLQVFNGDILGDPRARVSERIFTANSVPLSWDFTDIAVRECWLHEPSKKSRVNAVIAFGRHMSQVPLEVRTAIANSDYLQWPLLEMIAQVPDFLDFLMTDDGHRSRQFAMAVMSSQLSSQPETFNPGILAQRIMGESRSGMIAEQFNTYFSRGVLNVLGTMGAHPLSAENYLKFFRQHGDAETLRQIHPKGHELRRSLGDAWESRRQRIVQIDRDFRFIIASVQERAHFLSRREEKMILLRFPHPPFAIPGVLEPLTSPLLMDEEGNAMEHCVGSMWEVVIRRTAYFYRWLGTERATVELLNVGGSWHVGQIKGPKNATISAQTVSLIKSLVRRNLTMDDKIP